MMTTSDNKVYIGYHGTNYENVESIIKHGFHVSDNADEWLGHGIYFFTEGISDPIENKTIFISKICSSKSGSFWQTSARFDNDKWFKSL